MTTYNLDSVRFSWTAPTAGTGTIRMYLAGYQGSSQSSGQNYSTVIVSNEQSTPLPTAATNPSPANSATGVTPGVNTLTWTAGTGATSRDVFFGTTNPPASIGNRTTTSYTTSALTQGTTYYWRIDERNATGATTGTVWSFTTLTAALPSTPAPRDGDTVQTASVLLEWQYPSTPAPMGFNVYAGNQNPPPMLSTASGTARSLLDSLRNGDGTYYWRVDPVFSWGTVTGPIWSFTKTTVNGVTEISPALPVEMDLAKAYPNPFNPTTTIRYSIAHPSNVTLQVFDLTGNIVATLANGRQSAGSYSVTWDASNHTSGIYFYRLTADNRSLTGRMLLIK